MKTQSLFENICEEYYEKVLYYLFSVLKNETAARDCTQEVFLVALQKEAILTQHPNVGGFLFQTAKNLSKKHYRTHFSKMLKEDSSDGRYRELVDDSSDIEAILDRQIDEREYIDSILEKLTEEKRELYILCYVEGKPMAEIAGMLNIKEPALRMRYVRLRKEITELVRNFSRKEFSV